MDNVVSGSFRDPSGFLFTRKGVLYRQINQNYQQDYEALNTSGLYDLLVGLELLIPHQEVSVDIPLDNKVYKVIKPSFITNISYPYEWSFSQLKDAALLTLEIQRLALTKDLTLKDASAYNVLFNNGKPIFIDTLSFEILPQGLPWVAYRQFCQHFLAPLALMAKKDINLGQLLKTNIDGIPLRLASKLLPFRSRIDFSLAIHIHLHARSQAQYENKQFDRENIKRCFTKTSFFALIDNLSSSIKKLKWDPIGTEWHDYYEENNNYGRGSLNSKEQIVRELLEKESPAVTWDFGSNTGRFSRIAAEFSQTVCAWDIDPACVEINYRSVKQNRDRKIIPLLLDLTNPTPSLGWNNDERMSMTDRGPVDLILALGLIHHLAISNNLPLDKIAKFFNGLTNVLIIEFVPKTDSQVKKLLLNRHDIFPLYEQKSFEKFFLVYFSIEAQKIIPDTDRTLYRMKRLFKRKS